MAKKKKKIQGIEAPHFTKVFDAVCAAIKTYPLVYTKYKSIRVRVTNDFRTIVLSGSGVGNNFIFPSNGGRFVKKYKVLHRLDAFRIAFFFYQEIRKCPDVSVVLKETDKLITVTVNRFPMLTCTYRSGAISIEDLKKEQEKLQTEPSCDCQDEITARNYGINLLGVLSDTTVPEEMRYLLPAVSTAQLDDNISLLLLTSDEKKDVKKGTLYYKRLSNPNPPDKIPAPKIYPGRSTIRKAKPQPISLEGKGIPDRYDHDD